MGEGMQNLIVEFGYLSVFLLMLLENVFPPIPSEIILPLTGYLAARGELHPIFAIFAGSAGAVCGAAIWYFVGLKVGKDRLERFFGRYGSWLAVSPEEYRKTMDFFERHSGKSVLMARLLPTFRTLISIPAGMVEMSLRKFFLLTTVGTIIWTALLVYLGFIFGAQSEIATRYVSQASNLILMGLVLLYFVKVVRVKFFHH